MKRKIKGKRTLDFLAETFFNREKRRGKNMNRKLNIEFSIKELKEISYALDLEKRQIKNLLKHDYSEKDEKILNESLETCQQLIEDFSGMGI